MRQFKARGSLRVLLIRNMRSGSVGLRGSVSVARSNWAWETVASSGKTAPHRLRETRSPTMGLAVGWGQTSRGSRSRRSPRYAQRSIRRWLPRRWRTPTILQPSNQIVAAGRPLHEPLPGYPGDLGAANEEIFDRDDEYSPGAMQGNGGLVSLTCLLVTIDDVCPVFLLLEHEAVAAASRELGTLLAAIFGVELADPVEFRFALFTIFFTRDRSPPDAEVLASGFAHTRLAFGAPYGWRAFAVPESSWRDPFPQTSGRLLDCWCFDPQTYRRFPIKGLSAWLCHVARKLPPHQTPGRRIHD
jgi:hypothetical protein